MDPSADSAAFRAVHRSQRHILRNVVLIAAAVLLVLACTAGIVYKRLADVAEQKALHTAGDTTDRFVRDLEGGDHPAAYDLLCTATRGELTLDHFDADVRSRPRVRTHRRVDAHRLPHGVVVLEELTLDNGTVDTHTFMVVREDHASRICNRSWPY